jgi:hypothetical protein
MYLLSQSFLDSECHPSVGTAICFGLSLAPVVPAVADRFSRIISAKIVDAATATAHLVDSLRLQTKEQVTARQTLEKHLADAQSPFENVRDG